MTTTIEYVGPTKPSHNSYTAVIIKFAADFDLSALPKSTRAWPYMTINCTPRTGNALNETGVKRLRRILKALEGSPVDVLMPYENSITQDDFFSRTT